MALLPRSLTSRSEPVRRRAGRGSTPASVSITPFTKNSKAPGSVPAAITHCSFISGWPCRASHAHGEFFHEKAAHKCRGLLVEHRRLCAGGRYAREGAKGPGPRPCFHLVQLLPRCARRSGWARKDITDPVELVQNSFAGARVTAG